MVLIELDGPGEVAVVAKVGPEVEDLVVDTLVKDPLVVEAGIEYPACV